MSGAIVLVAGLIGLALAAWLVAREPDRRVRVAAIGGAAGGFLIALLLALLLGTSALGALATAVLGAAVLALALVGQWRLIRGLLRGRM